MNVKQIIPVISILVTTSLAFAAENIMPISQIKPGMKGIGKTVFAGTEIEQFEFEVLDIIPNFRAKRDLILVKLIGDEVEYSGVVAGMSGSPMYIDGKLVGALAYRLGIFLKDPIAGITPIEQMLEILEQEKVRNEELAFQRGFNEQYVDMAMGMTAASLDNFVPPELKKNASTNEVAEITPLEVPLIFSGFENSVLELSGNLLKGSNFQIQAGGGIFFSTNSEMDAGELEPGSAYSVVLVDGDLGLQATGTVTYRDQDKIIGMGHPVLNSGAVGLPMGKAKILTTLSSLMASTKLAAHTEITGAIHQDRTTGVMGVTGEIPDMIPVHLTYRSKFQDVVDYNFRIAEDRSLYSLTPLILNLVLTNALESARLSVSNQTLKLEGSINLKNHEPISLQNYYAGSPPAGFVTDAMEATGEISAILGTLLANDFEIPEIESIELSFDTLHKKYLASVERLEVDKTMVRPGDVITLSVHIREYQGKEHKIVQTMEIPEDIQARRIILYAGSGEVLTQLEYRMTPQKFRPRNFNQLVEMLSNRRKNNFVFFQIRSQDDGVLMNGEELPGLPPSILSIINSQKSSGNVAPLRYRVISEDNVQVDYSISGGKTVWLNIEPKKE